MVQNLRWLAVLYLAAVNLIAFLLYGVDKSKAKHQAWRIPESTLLLVAWLGGAYGAAVGMKVWHHKTRKLKFRVFVPMAVVVWTVVLGICIWRR